MFVIIPRGIQSHITLVIMGSRIKTTDAPVVFTARGEVMLMSEGVYNAIMSVILNENMYDETKLDVIKMLIDKGCYVNWLNYQRETALIIALERIEIDIANMLLDNGAVIYKE